MIRCLVTSVILLCGAQDGSDSGDPSNQGLPIERVDLEDIDLIRPYAFVQPDVFLPDNFRSWQEDQLEDSLRMPDSVTIIGRFPKDFSLGELRRLDQIISEAQTQIVWMHALEDGLVPFNVDGYVFDEVGTLEEMIAFRDSAIEWTIGKDTSGAVSLEGERVEVPPFNQVEEEVPRVPQNTVCIIPKDRFVCDENNQPVVDENGFYTLQASTVRSMVCDVWGYNLCDKEQRGDWPSAGIGSGVLLEDKVILTAAHIIMEGEYSLKEVFFVFGYAYEDANTPLTQIPEENIYEHSRLIDCEFEKKMSDEHDWLILELDRSVIERFRNPSMRITTDPAAVSRDTVVHTFSYPLGSPLSFSGLQTIGLFDTENSGDLHVPFDISAGSSGAPIFNAAGQLVGIVIGKGWAKGTDFEIREDNCYRYTRIDTDTVMKRGHICLWMGHRDFEPELRQHLPGDMFND